MIDLIVRTIRPLKRQIANIVARAIVQNVDDSMQMQILQTGLLSGENRSGLERVQNYGFTSVPFPGAEGVALFVDGRRDNGFIIAVDDRRYRLTGLADGEVAIYTDQGDSIVIRRGGTIEVHASTKVQVTSPLVAFSGDVTVAGTLTATTDVVGGGKSLKTHTHSAGSLVAGSTPVTGISGGPS